MAFNMKGLPTDGAPKQSSGLNLFRKGRGKEYRVKKREVQKALRETGQYGDFTNVDLSGHNVGPGSKTATRRGARAFVKQELGIEDGKVNWSPGKTGVFTTPENPRPDFSSSAYAHANAKPGGIDVDLDVVVDKHKFVKSEAFPVTAGTKDKKISKTVKGEDVVTPHSFESTDLNKLKSKVEELKSDSTVSAIKKDDAEINQVGFRMKGWSGFTQMSMDDAEKEKKKKEDEGFKVTDENKTTTLIDPKDPTKTTKSTTTNVPLDPFGSYDHTDTETTEKKFTGERSDNVYIDLQKEIDSGFAKKKGFDGDDVKEYEKYKISGSDYKGPTEDVTINTGSSGVGRLDWNVTTPGEDKIVEETIKGDAGSIGESIKHEGSAITAGVDIDVDAKKKEKVKCGPGEKKDENGNCVPRRVEETTTTTKEKKKPGMKKVCTNWEWVEKGSGQGASRSSAGSKPTMSVSKTKTKMVRNV